MEFTHTEERSMLADTLRRLIADKYPIETRHQSAESELGYSGEFWSECAELGLIGALFTEEAGGFGGAGFDISVVFEELGRGLVVEPFLATLLGGTALVKVGRIDLLEAIISGETRVAFAHYEPTSRYELADVTTTAQDKDGSWILSGQKSYAYNANSADFIVVTARTSGEVDDENGISLFLVPKDVEGLTVRSYPTLDGYRAAEISLDGVSLSGEALLAEDAFGIIEEVISAGAFASAAEAVGASDVAAELTLDYLKTRTQFGRPIGTFQALQHRMADMMIEIEQLRSSLINASDRFDKDRATREWAVSAVKTLAGQTGRLVSEETIQLHGGIAMTWEYAAGHYAKRLVMIDHMFGDSDHHLERAVAL